MSSSCVSRHSDPIEITPFTDGGAHHLVKVRNKPLLLGAGERGIIGARGRDLLRAFSDMANAVDAEGNVARQHETALSTNVRKKAIELFDALIPDDSDRALLINLLRHPTGQRVNLNIVPGAPELPWEALAFSDSGPIHFLGDLASFSIAQCFEPRSKGTYRRDVYVRSPAAFKDDFEFLTSRPDKEAGLIVRFAEDDQLHSARQLNKELESVRDTHIARAIEEYYVLEEFAGSEHGVDQLELLDLVAGNRPIQCEKLHKWLGKGPAHVWHFNCHTLAPSSAIEGSTRKLQLRRRFDAREEELRPASCFDFAGALVCLNCCEGSTAIYAGGNTLAGLFHSQYADAVLCTTGEVPDTFATAFARNLYRNLKGGDTLGDALFRARGAFNGTTLHPFAQLYTVVGNSSHIV